MIIAIHNHERVVAIKNYSENSKEVVCNLNQPIFCVLQEVANSYSDCLIGWCHEKMVSKINVEKWEVIFHHSLVFASFTPGTSNVEKWLGYIDQSPFVNVEKTNKSASWFAYTCVGGVHASVLRNVWIDETTLRQNSFKLVLNIFTKKLQPQGLLCYVNPNLLSDAVVFNEKNLSIKELFILAKNCYKGIWLWVMFWMLLFYEKTIAFFPLINGLFIKSVKITHTLQKVDVKSNSTTVLEKEFTIDVIIPTLGRSKYLYDVLKDFSIQTILPKKIIIVEQNPLEASVSELAYLQTETWPFDIEHVFIHQLGACNARNIALNRVSNNWVFFADDDVRFEKDLLANSLQSINQYGATAIGLSCLQKGEVELSMIVLQSTHFGSGTSIVKKECLEGVFFKKEHELGYGEDLDYGMQLRNKGIDVLFFPTLTMLHLKAPSGGFRTSVVKPWELNEVVPKPSPTVMAYYLKHTTIQQLRTYRWLLYLKYYRNQPIKNPLKYVRSMHQKWESSKQWAKKMMNDEV